MEPGLELKYVWHDSDVDEIEICASSGGFSGSTRAYISKHVVSSAAQMLLHFPQNSSDVRELQFGVRGENAAGGWAHLRFSCKDLAAHAILEIHIESKDEWRPASRCFMSPQSAHFFAEIEAAAVDDFVRELGELNRNEDGAARLRFSA